MIYKEEKRKPQLVANKSSKYDEMKRNKNCKTKNQNFIIDFKEDQLQSYIRHTNTSQTIVTFIPNIATLQWPQFNHWLPKTLASTVAYI